MKKNGKIARAVARDEQVKCTDERNRRSSVDKTARFVEWLRATPSLDSWRHLPMAEGRSTK
jgi:hypothetical protein